MLLLLLGNELTNYNTLPSKLDWVLWFSLTASTPLYSNL